MQANLSHLGAIFNVYLALDCVPLVVWARKKIDKIKKSFLCKGGERKWDSLSSELAHSLQAKRSGQHGSAKLG
jgi:hypothetical protein